jgi:hypothetical protein
MGVLPFVLLALCPLMHLFHGRTSSNGADREPGVPAGSDGGRTAPPAAPRPPHSH